MGAGKIVIEIAIGIGIERRSENTGDYLEIRKAGRERAISPLRLCASAGDMLLSLADGLPFEAASAQNGSLPPADKAGEYPISNKEYPTSKCFVAQVRKRISNIQTQGRSASVLG